MASGGQSNSAAEVLLRAEKLTRTLILPSLESEQRELEGLPVPEGDEAQIAEIWDASAQLIREIDEGGPKAVFTSDAKLTYSQKAARYGLTSECRI